MSEMVICEELDAWPASKCFKFYCTVAKNNTFRCLWQKLFGRNLSIPRWTTGLRLSGLALKRTATLSRDCSNKVKGARALKVDASYATAGFETEIWDVKFMVLFMKAWNNLQTQLSQERHTIAKTVIWTLFDCRQQKKHQEVIWCDAYLTQKQ